MLQLTTSLIILAGLVICLKTLLDVVKAVKKELFLVVEEFRLERESLRLQKEILAVYQLQMHTQNALLEQKIAMAMNSVNIMKMMAERAHDPKWVAKFDEGRDNAKYN